jgi:hypothetical protein
MGTTNTPCWTVCRAGRSYRRDLAEAQVPSTFRDSLPSSLALALAQQLFVLGGLIPFETIKRRV